VSADRGLLAHFRWCDHFPFALHSVEEIRAIAAIAKRRHLKVHMDGARFANAVAALDVHPSEITWRAGVDVLCFGGTKNGLPVGEVVVFFDRALADDFAYRLKQAGQLAARQAPYETIHVPRNSAVGVALAFFTSIGGFALVWHIWWLAIVCFVGLLVAALSHGWIIDREMAISPEQLAALDRERST